MDENQRQDEEEGHQEGGDEDDWGGLRRSRRRRKIPAWRQSVDDGDDADNEDRCGVWIRYCRASLVVMTSVNGPICI